MSSFGTSRAEATIYASAEASRRSPNADGPWARGDTYRLAITVASGIATLLTLLGAASILAGLAGVLSIADLGIVRTASYLGLGLAGAGSGGLLLIVLGDLAKATRRRGQLDSSRTAHRL